MQLCAAGVATEQGHAGTVRPLYCLFPAPFRPAFLSRPALFLLFPDLLACALPSKRSFHAFFLAGFQIKGVALDLFNNVFLLHFALEAAQGVLKRLTLLQSNFRQTDTPPNPPGRTE
jgi:hypothetical protein